MAKIGSLNVALGLQTAQFSAGAKKAQAEVSGLQKSFAGLKNSMSGLTAGLGLGALAGTFAAAAKRGLDYASSLGEVSQQIGIGTRDLQAFRYAATQVGVSQEDMDKGLSKLTVSLGKAQSGSKQAQAAFAAIGISMDEIKGKDTGEVIRIVADHLAKIPNPAQRAAAEVALFGKAGQKLDTLLSGGRKAIDELTLAAEKLGIILSDEQIQKADDTADKLAALNTVLEARIAGTVTDNADSIMVLANSLADLVQFIGDADRAWKGSFLAQQINSNQLTSRVGLTKGIRAAARERLGGNMATAANDMASMAFGMMPGMAGATPKRLRPARAAIADIPGTGGGGGRKAGGGGGRGKSAEQVARDAERAADERSRAAKESADNLRRFNAEEMQANADLLSAQAALTQSTKQMAQAEFNQLNTRRQIDLAENAAREELNEGQKAVRARQIQEQFEADNALLAQRENADLAQEAARLQEIRNDAALAQIQLEVDGATTASERRAAELRLLDATIGLERARLEDIKATNASTSAAYQDAELRLQGLQTKRDVAATGVQRNTMGPMESYLATLPRTAAQANEAMEALAAQGISSIVDGLTDAAMGARSLGDVFKQVAKSIIADLLRIQIRKGIASALGSLIPGFGGFGGGMPLGRDPAPGVGTFRVRKWANGGGGILGGRAGLDANLLSLNGSPLANVTRGEHIRVSPGGTEIPRGNTTNFTVNAPGATAETVMMIRRELANAAPAIINASTQATMRAATRNRL